jgi:hypothetical protein
MGMGDADCMRARPRVFALFQKRIDGDDALLHLARARFREARLGAEFYANTQEELAWLIGFSPFPDMSSMAHLSRSISLFDRDSRNAVIECARRFGEKVYGIVVHDEAGIATRLDEYVEILGQLQSRLMHIPNSPLLFIEYAVGLDPETFLSLFRAAESLSRVSCCIDIGHLGLRLARRHYAEMHPGDDVCNIRPDDASLHGLLGDIETSLRSAVQASASIISRLCSLGKPTHFHLHDAHPLSTSSPFGVSDHLSFLEDIPLSLSHYGSRSLRPMYGPSGLSRIVEASLTLPPESLSFSLEIHPSEVREALGPWSHLFDHWVDRKNAERMNHWLSVLIKNYTVLQEILGSMRPTPLTRKRSAS